MGAPPGVFAKQETVAGGGGGAIQTCPFWLEYLIPFVASGFSIVLNCFNIFRLEMCISGIMSLGRDFIDHIYR